MLYHPRRVLSHHCRLTQLGPIPHNNGGVGVWPTSSFSEAGVAAVRLAQAKVAAALPRVGLAHTFDCTDILSLYSARHRHLIARRLAGAFASSTQVDGDQQSKTLSSPGVITLHRAGHVGGAHGQEKAAQLCRSPFTDGSFALPVAVASSLVFPGIVKRAALQLWRSAGGPLPPLWHHRLLIPVAVPPNVTLTKADTADCSDCCADDPHVVEVGLSEGGPWYGAEVQVLHSPEAGDCEWALLVTPLCTDEPALPYRCDDLSGPLQKRPPRHSRKRRRTRPLQVALGGYSGTLVVDPHAPSPPFTHIRYGLTLFPECAFVGDNGAAVVPTVLQLAAAVPV